VDVFLGHSVYIVWYEVYFDILDHLGVTQECDGQIDGQTDGRTYL